MTVAFISHADCKLHEMGAHHPEQAARLDAINNRMIASGLSSVLYQYDAPKATRQQLLLAHDEAYVSMVFDASPTEGLAWLDGDTAMNPNTLEAALRAAGAAVLGIDLVMTDKAKQVFCAVRPPGHHAERHKAMGFCFFNNVAIAAYYAIKQYDLQRVVIVDFDVHHGNGTEDIVAGDERILFFSSFQHPFYPGTGAHSKIANVHNTPLPAYSDGETLKRAISETWIPEIEAFAPELIIISAGFDGHRDDEMAQFKLHDSDYAWITDRLMQLARMSAGGRVVSCLEGGYELQSLARSVEAHIKAFF